MSQEPDGGEGAALQGVKRGLANPGNWGLLPAPGADGKLDPAAVLRYWFVQFNPLYFISAFCVLYGVFLVARNIDSLSGITPERAQLVLFAVIQAYEFLLVGGAAFLVHRAATVRPAVLLALLEALFLFDCTFRLEGVALTGPLAAPLTLAVWLLLTTAKVWGLATALRVRMSPRHYAAIAASAAGIVGVIMFLSRPETNKLTVLQLAAWFGTAVMLALVTWRPALMSQLAQTRDDQVLAQRCIGGIFRLLAGAYFYHLWSYILLAASIDIQGAAILPQVGAFLLLYTIIRPKDVDVWRFGACTVACAMPAALTLPWALFLIAAVFAYRVWRGARSGIAVGAAGAVYAGLWLLGWGGWDEHLPPLPALLSWQSAALAIALGLIGWFLRDRLVWAMLGAGILYGAYRTVEPLVPKSELGLGMLLLGAGFIAFAIGLAVNWRFRAASPAARDNAADGDAPAQEALKS